MTKGEEDKDGERLKADRQRERGLVDLLKGFPKSLWYCYHLFVASDGK